MLDFSLQLQSLVLAQADLPFYRSGIFIFGALIALLFVMFWLANVVSKSLRMPDYSGRLAVIFTALGVATMVIAYGWPPKLGVDLRGGVNIVGQLNLDAFRGEEGQQVPTAEEIIPKLLQRVDPSGTREIMIRPLGVDKIEVTIPDVQLADADEIWNRLVKTGHLQFRIVATSEFHPAAVSRAMEKMNQGDMGRDIQIVDAEGKNKTLARWYNIAREELVGMPNPNVPLALKYVPNIGQLVRDRATGTIVDLQRINFSGQEDLMGLEFAKYLKSQGIRTPQILLMEPESEASNVEGKHLAWANPDIDEKGRACVSFKLTPEGSSRMGRMTTMNKPRGESYKQLAIVLDDALVSAPRIEEPIFRNGRISGKFTQAEVDDLCINLKSGKIEVALNKTPISKQYTLSTLGEELKQKGIWAIGISLVLVLVFMLVYYQWFAGGVSCLALGLNVVLILACVILIKQPLTLTGLAGLVLTIGMAVDANVLIFERIREELQRGASLKMSIRNGFDRATTTIIDANVTTLITAIVLYVIGTEQIKGFSVTLILGILMSMFTAIYCSRTVFEIAERRRTITSLSMMQLFAPRRFNFLSKSGVAITASIILILAGVAGMVMLKSKILDIDLRGGSTARVIFNEATDIESIRTLLAADETKVNDEKIEYVVTELVDDEFPNRVFKIDSTVPTPNPELGQNWDPLDTLLERLLQGKLRMHNVQFDPSKIKVEEVDTTKPSGIGKLDSGVESPKMSTIPFLESRPAVYMGMAWEPKVLAWRSVGDESEFARLESDAMQQESEAGAANTQETEAAKQEGAAESGVQAETVNQDGQTQDAGESAATEGAVVQENETQAAENNDLPGVGNAATVVNTKKYRASVVLNFDNPITPSSVRTLISEMATRLDKNIEEEQISILVPGDPIAEVENSTMRTDWDLTIESNGQDDAGEILSAFAKEFNEKVYFPTTSGVGSQVAGDAQLQALGAIAASLLGIIIYVWIRFQNIAFGLAAVIALIHDVLVVLGAIALSNYVARYLGFMLIDDFKISLTVLAAILTVIGYSLNDTIVIFDRIREIRGKRQEMNADMINESISQTMGRTILTSLTTFIVVFILFVFGGESIHAFAFTLVIGIIAGTYSTIFIATPALLWLIGVFGVDTESEPDALTKSI